MKEVIPTEDGVALYNGKHPKPPFSFKDFVRYFFVRPKFSDAALEYSELLMERLEEKNRRTITPMFIGVDTARFGKDYSHVIFDEGFDDEYEKRVLGRFEDIRVDSHGFMECDTCRAKAGAPYLCVSCLHNRDLIHLLRSRLEK